jgi:transposase-like protein
MEDKITCKYCGSMNVAKKGARKIRHGSRHIYSCKNCFKRFSIGLNKKQFDAWLIVNAVCLYNKGYSYEEACEFIARKHKAQVGKSSVERWAKEYSLGFLDIRDRIISKYGRDCIIERAFNHSGLVYNFMLHKGKLKEFGKFSGLKDFIFSLAKGVDEKFFNGERCSQSSEGISCKIDVSENARLNSVVGEMLKIVKSNKQRHMLVENLMLHCDRDSVAVEVPVWYWNKKINEGVCGHIDVLQVKFGKVWILDYKPDAEKENFERVMSQLYNYALALSFRSGLALRDIKCAWFDSSRIYSFEPERVVFSGKDKKEEHETEDEKAEEKKIEEKEAEDEKIEEKIRQDLAEEKKEDERADEKQEGERGGIV